MVTEITDGNVFEKDGEVVSRDDFDPIFKAEHPDASEDSFDMTEAHDKPQVRKPGPLETRVDDWLDSHEQYGSPTVEDALKALHISKDEYDAEVNGSVGSYEPVKNLSEPEPRGIDMARAAINQALGVADWKVGDQARLKAQREKASRPVA